MENDRGIQIDISGPIDPIFSGTPITDIAPAISSIPKSIFKIGEEKIFIIKKYLQLIWDFYFRLNDQGRLINVSEMLDNCFSLFITDQLRVADKYWKEHASANLRELTDKLSIDNYSQALTCIDNNDLDVSSNFKKIQDIRACLHNCAHFRTESCIENAKVLLNITDQKITDEQIFDNIVANYLMSIYFIVSKCKGKRI